MNNAVFGKKHRDMKLVTEKRRKYLVSKPNYSQMSISITF